MRNLTKLPEPDILVQFSQQWTAELLAEQPGTAAFKRIESRYGHQTIRDRLRDELHKKCAYCESNIEAVAYPHIEHMLPKARHRNLTFVWINVTLACPVCNINKGHTEPTANNFINPYFDMPEERFTFLGSILSPAPNDLAARNMINWLDLNRPELVISRSEIVHRVMEIYERATSLPQAARREFVDLAIRPLTALTHQHSWVAFWTSRALEAFYAGRL